MILYIFITALTIALACFVRNGRCMQTGQLSNTYAQNYRITNNENTPKIKQTIPITGYKRVGITRRQGQNLLCLFAIFIILFLLSALRLEVGNDYGTYVDTIHEIYVGGYVVTEPLFNAVSKLLCELSGGENYLLVFGFFGFITIWLFLKILYEQTENFAMAFFLFMTLGLYFRTFNTVRYYFALAIALYSYRYVLKKEYVKFVLLIAVTALFHKSVLVVIPLYLIANYTWKKWQIAVMGMGAVGLVIFQDFVMKIALELYPSYKNTIYLENGEGVLGNVLSIGRCVAVLILALLCYKEALEDNKANQFYFKLNLISIVLYICASFLPLVGRIVYYLMSSHILFIPSILGQIKNEKKKKVLQLLVVTAGVLYFLLFLKTATQDGVRVLPYKSWLFYEKEFLNAGEIF